MTWTFDPLQSKNAHLNFGKLGVVSDVYRIDFYGPETSSVLHQNGTDRLWVRWPLASRRVRDRLQGKDYRPEVLDAFSRLQPLVQFNGDGRPLRNDLSAALARQRIAIQIPSDIGAVERKDPRIGARMAGGYALGVHRGAQVRFLRCRVLPHRSRAARPGQLPAGEGQHRRLRSGAAEKVLELL